ncbi:MAG: hypothetical protein HQK98_05235 [Nitrospirae bacterium]|nr:hypothetical protein [Nitrospirota bacterium]
MNDEILRLKGQLAEYERELRRLFIAITGDKNMIRIYLPAHVVDEEITSLKTDLALEAMTRLHDHVKKAKKLEGNIKEVKTALGCED